jgi:hypothetical protein
MDYMTFKTCVNNSDLPKFGKLYNCSLGVNVPYYQYVSGIHEITYDLESGIWYYTSNRVANNETLLIGVGQTLSEAIETYKSFPAI